MSVPVSVNLAVNVSATGVINVFTQDAPTITDMIVASNTPSATILYASDVAGEAAFQFQGVSAEAPAALDDIVGSYNAAFYAANSVAVANALHDVLTNELDAAAAQPFNLGMYTSADHKEYDSFGELALSAYAHHVFGHAAATAAIDNDTAFITAMNGRGATDADLANKLMVEIFTTASPTAIVKQVLGQDPSRAMNADNDAITPDTLQNLEFKAGDEVYVSITLDPPTVSTTDSASATIAGLGIAYPVAGIKYTIKITLA